MEDPQVITSAPPLSSAPPPVVAQDGLADNVAGALAYITIIPAILFLILEPYNKRPFVKFHAFQCLGLTLTAFALSLILVIPILGWIVGVLGDVVLLVFWVLCIIKALSGEKYKVPFIGNYVETLAK